MVRLIGKALRSVSETADAPSAGTILAAFGTLISEGRLNQPAMAACTQVLVLANDERWQPATIIGGRENYFEIRLASGREVSGLPRTSVLVRASGACKLLCEACECAMPEGGKRTRSTGAIG